MVLIQVQLLFVLVLESAYKGRFNEFTNDDDGFINYTAGGENFALKNGGASNYNLAALNSETSETAKTLTATHVTWAD